VDRRAKGRGRSVTREPPKIPKRFVVMERDE